MVKHGETEHRCNDVLVHLSCLPRHILALNGLSNISEFVLCHLAAGRCFNFDKAAYLVDNPDFNCLQGISGFTRQEAYHDLDEMWADPAAFTRHMASAPFNQKVKNYAWCSIDRAPEPNEELIRTVARDLALENPSYRCWRTKHDNNGILIFEGGGSCSDLPADFLDNSLYYFGFCPIC